MLKSLIGLISLIGGCCAIGVPLAMSATEIPKESQSAVPVSEELENGSGGATNANQ